MLHGANYSTCGWSQEQKRNEKNLYVLVVGAISVMNLHDVYLLYEQKYQVDNRNVHCFKKDLRFLRVGSSE